MAGCADVLCAAGVPSKHMHGRLAGPQARSECTACCAVAVDGKRHPRFNTPMIARRQSRFRPPPSLPGSALRQQAVLAVEAFLERRRTAPRRGQRGAPVQRRHCRGGRHRAAATLYSFQQGRPGLRAGRPTPRAAQAPRGCPLFQAPPFSSVRQCEVMVQAGRAPRVRSRVGALWRLSLALPGCT